MGKIIIYQVFTRLFGNKNTSRIENGSIEENGTGKFVDFDTKTLRRIRKLGATHIWYTGIIRHASCTDYSQFGIPVQHPSVIKGRAGSPYAITDYYDVDPDLAVDVEKRMEEWEELIRRTHKEGMKVVMDFVPNHVARQYQSIAKPVGTEDLGSGDNEQMHFSPQNNFYYCVGENFVSPNGTGYSESPAKATGNDCFSAYPSINDWYETVKLNYGIDYNDWSGVPSEHFEPIPSTWKKMTDILLFWANKGVDAFRCDMAEMVPCAFWKYSIAILKKEFPNVEIIGEVYNPTLYRKYISSGFDYLYDKVGLYDTLRAVVEGKCPTSAITHQWQNVDDIRSRMLYFLENHDEQRIASDYFAGNGEKGIPAMIVSSMLYSNPLMIYAGQEFGERGMDKEGFSGKDGRTTIFDYWCVDSLRRGFFDRRKLTSAERILESQYISILNIARKEKSIVEGASYDLMYVNPQLGEKQFAFLRGNNMLIVVNFDDNAVESSVFIPAHAFDHLNMAEGETEALNLLTEEKQKISLEKDSTVKVYVPANGGTILKW